MSIDRYKRQFGSVKPLPGQPGYGMKESERLFQETKNMELVGVRNIQLSDELPTFSVDTGVIYKVLSWSTNNLIANSTVSEVSSFTLLSV